MGGKFINLTSLLTKRHSRQAKKHKPSFIAYSKKEHPMPKMKTHSGAKKSLKRLGSGKVKRKKAGRRHLLVNKSRKRTLHLNDQAYVHSANTYQVNRMLID